MPIFDRDKEPLPEVMADLRARAERAGRDPATVTVSLFGVPADEARLAGFRDAGLYRAIFYLPSAGRDRVLPLLDQYAAVSAPVALAPPKRVWTST